MQIWIYAVYKYKHGLNLCSQKVQLCCVTRTAKYDAWYPYKCIASTPALYKVKVRLHLLLAANDKCGHLVESHFILGLASFFAWLNELRLSECVVCAVCK